MESLFDFADDEQQPDTSEQPDWHEAPQALFLSWPPAKQFAYCAARDIDSAGRAETAAEIDWYLARAKSYQEMIRGS